LPEIAGECTSFREIPKLAAFFQLLRLNRLHTTEYRISATGSKILTSPNSIFAGRFLLPDVLFSMHDVIRFFRIFLIGCAEQNPHEMDVLPSDATLALGKKM
jgi:hypothetical protein